MRNEVNRKILVDLFAQATVLFPVVGGLTGIIFSWMISVPILGFGGAITAMVGFGVFASRLIWGLDKIAKDAHAQVLKQAKDEKNKILDELEIKLKQDRDPRPEACLQQLRALHVILSESQKSDSGVWSQVAEDFERLFEVCVKQIKKTDDLWRAGRKKDEIIKKSLKRERERIIKEIEETTLHLTTTIQQFKLQASQNGNSELAEARKELEQTIEVAKKVDRRLADFGNKNYDPKEFENENN